MGNFQKTKINKGFTALEILLVVSIVAIIAALTIFSFADLNKTQVLERSSSSVISILEEARSRTLSAEGDSNYGVQFRALENELILFKGSDFSSGEVVKTTPLHSSVGISDIDLEDGSDYVVFNRLTGETDQHGSITLSVTNDPDSFQEIFIFSTGLVQLD